MEHLAACGVVVAAVAVRSTQRLFQTSGPAASSERGAPLQDPRAEHGPSVRSEAPTVECEHKSFRLHAKAALQPTVPLQSRRRFALASRCRRACARRTTDGGSGSQRHHRRSELASVLDVPSAPHHCGACEIQRPYPQSLNIAFLLASHSRRLTKFRRRSFRTNAKVKMSTG